MRKFINIINEADLAEFPDTRTIRVFHGTNIIEPFGKFEKYFLNSRAGRAHGAFFFSGLKSTAMTYLDTEEVLKPQVQKKYDELMAAYNIELNKVLIHTNKVLADHGEPPLKKYDRWELITLANNRRKNNPNDALRDEINRIKEMTECDWYRDQARELKNREVNMTTSYRGALYTCDLHLNTIWSKDMNGMSFEKDRWTDIFNAATQFEPDAVALHNVVDTGCDFGSPDTVYAVFNPRNIEIIGTKIFSDE